MHADFGTGFSILSVPDMLKATPVTEGENRFVFMEASNENIDVQGERVRMQALADSAAYFLKFGNLDIQHRSIIGLANGDPNYLRHEIGAPVEVKFDDKRTFVKGSIFRGEGEMAQCANDFWESLTQITPPMKWYPSVAGKILSSDIEMDKARGPITVLTQVRWSNIGFSRTPVNPTLAGVSIVPFGIFKKCWTDDGLDMVMLKALDAGGGGLTAGYGTDSAGLSGGGALRKQSLDRGVQSYWDLRDKLAADIMAKKVHPTAPEMVAHAASAYGIGRAEAAQHVARFMSDLKTGLNSKRKSHDQAVH